jgi:hypothetical protein
LDNLNDKSIESDITKPYPYLNIEAPDESLKEQVSLDLRSKYNEYSNNKIALNHMSRQMGIHEKTLKRLIAKQNRPGHQTLLKIYRCLLQTNNDNDVLENSPRIVREKIKENYTPNHFTQTVYTQDLTQEFVSDKCMMEIYIQVGSGGVSLECIQFKFGEYGVNCLKKLLAHKAIVLDSKGLYQPGEVQMSFNSEQIKQVGLHLSTRYTKPQKTDELGQNFLGFYCEGLNETGYREWIKIDEQAYAAKKKLAAQESNRGDIKAFCYTTTDTMKES